MTASARLPPAPVGQQAPPAHAATRLMGALRVAWVPPIDYGDGLASHLTPEGNTEINKCIQRRPHAHRATPIGIAGMLTPDQLTRVQ
jgi:hypothetical protein